MSSSPPCPRSAVARPDHAVLGWPLERVLFAMAGTMTVLATVLTLTVGTWFVLLAAFVGLNQLLFVLTGACPASLALTRVFHVQRSLPR